MVKTNMESSFEAFKTAYEDICKKHKLQIFPSAYDDLQVWELQEDQMQQLIDRTPDFLDGQKADG